MKKLLAHLASTKSKFTDEQMKIVEKLLTEQEEEMQARFSLGGFFTPLIATFGLVATFYGLEKIIDNTFLADQPWVTLGVGVAILLLTGVYYQKLR